MLSISMSHKRVPSWIFMEYEVYFVASTDSISTAMLFSVTNLPSYIIVEPAHANQSTSLVIGGQNYPVQIVCADANQAYMPGVVVQASIVNAPVGSNILLNNELDSAITDTDGVATLTVNFVSGLSGVYSVQFSGNGLVSSTVIDFNVTNPVGSVTFEPSTIPTSILVLDNFPVTPIVTVLDVNGYPIQGKYVNVIPSNPGASVRSYKQQSCLASFHTYFHQRNEREKT
eukprot:TRINITY_DN1383_c0_g1_i12.p1 TRINITY_DN1383_c0_g1~~TRINITY_DN1383_c0_g1_i12.p1  ORF type:complete len:229 (+),score=29.16 TRINITY_DN1383_c0_g1_i12:1195-1881(+)